MNSRAVAASDSAKVTLVEMRPEHSTGNGRDAYVVTGSETTAAMTGDWWVQALVYLMVLATVVSGADYFLNFRRRLEQASRSRERAQPT